MENGAFKTPWIPKVDLSETNDAYVVRLEVAGVQMDDLDVETNGTTLTISGHRDMQHVQKEKYIWREREDGNFVRVLRLPTEVVEREMRASVGNGLLTVRLPKKAEPAVMAKILHE